jgi:hypothetical protein
MTLALILILLAAGTAAAIIGTSNDSNSVHLRQIVGDKAQQITDEIQQLVEDNTQ